jgi:hypothetical protein
VELPLNARKVPTILFWARSYLPKTGMLPCRGSGDASERVDFIEGAMGTTLAQARSN